MISVVLLNAKNLTERKQKARAFLFGPSLKILLPLLLIYCKVLVCCCVIYFSLTLFRQREDGGLITAFKQCGNNAVLCLFRSDVVNLDHENANVFESPALR